MLHDSYNGAMLSMLLGILALSSLCSAMMRPDTIDSGDEDGSTSTSDPNTFHWSGTQEEDTPDQLQTRSYMLYPPNGHPGPDTDNTTNGSNMLRILGATDPAMPPMPDTAICDMLLNAPVPPPIDQIPFFCLCTHCKGTVGPKGDRGDRGPPGAPGSPGIRGMMGFKGRPGFTGAQGLKGQKGDLGEKGHPGAVGLTGTKGERGFKGEKGDRGLEGPAGVPGPQGVSGTCPATCESVQGPPGTQGVPGPAGVRGLPGVPGPIGPKGFKGDKGDLGRPGDPGLNGQKGDMGEKGLCDCKDGKNGTDGRPGATGAKGDKGDTGAQGLQGSTGLKGDKGNMGLIGIPGPCSPAIQSAFSACINESYPINNLPVPFPHVISNMQGHFNPMRGIYTAPVNGTYVFTFHLAVADKTLKVGLFRDFYPVIKTTEGSQQRSTTSQTVVLHLLLGQRVWLQVKDTITNGMYTDSESSSTFSGYLLHPDTCDVPLGRQFIPPWDDDEEVFDWDGPKESTTTTPSP